MMMNSEHSVFYFSIESRKGGVGKTTVSLSLAQNLIAKKYQVLYVDLDLIGTQIAGDFFKGKEKHLHEVRWKNRSANLVEIYKQTLLSGEKPPAFSLSESKDVEGWLSAKEGVCNCLGSNIYLDSQGDGSHPILLDDPRLLYDSFHAFWMLEMVKSLAHSFANCFQSDQKIAVLLDHSPGYSSIESVFHDYLTDLGPKKGKILFVSSIDAQDLAACRQSMNDLKAIYKDKVAASNYYFSFLNKDTPHEKVISSDYFDSVFSRLCVMGDATSFYYSQKTLSEDPFVSILVNKIPEYIYEKVFDKRKASKKRVENILRNNEIPSPFLDHLQFFFSRWIFENNGITIKLNNDRKKYRLSGDVKCIANDQAKYNGFIRFWGNKERRIGKFFKPEWSPVAPFEDLVKYMRSQEWIGFDVQIDLTQSICSQIFKEEDIYVVVENFILENSNCAERIRMKVHYVKENVKKRFRNFELNECRDLLFDVYVEDFQELKGDEQLLSLYGIAVYRLKEYEKYSSLITLLMENFTRDITVVSRLDQSDLSDKISKVLEGQSGKGDELHKEIKKIIAEQYNLSMLNNALDRVIKELKVE